MGKSKRPLTPERNCRLRTEGPHRFVQSYRRRTDFGLITRIRYDPNYEESTLHDRTCKRYSAGCYFLCRLHFEQLAFDIEYLDWPIRMTYRSFMSIVHNFFMDTGADGEKPHIISFVLFADGEVALEAAETEPIENMFSGLMDHMRILHGTPRKKKKGSKTYLLEQVAIPVYIDTECTLPSKDTALNTTNTRVYRSVVSQVKEDYKLYDGSGKFDVLIWSSMQYVMSTLQSVVAIFRDGAWYVPHPDTGCRMDPLRMVLIEQGIVQEATFNVRRLVPGDDVLLISAQYGVRRGVLMGTTPLSLTRYGRSRKHEMHVKQEAEEGASDYYDADVENASRAVFNAPKGEYHGIPGTFIMRLVKGRPRHIDKNEKELLRNNEEETSPRAGKKETLSRLTTDEQRDITPEEDDETSIVKLKQEEMDTATLKEEDKDIVKLETKSDSRNTSDASSTE